MAGLKDAQNRRWRAGCTLITPAADGPTARRIFGCLHPEGLNVGDLLWQRGLCGCDEVQDLGVGRMFWTIWVGADCHLRGPC